MQVLNDSFTLISRFISFRHVLSILITIDLLMLNGCKKEMMKEFAMVVKLDFNDSRRQVEKRNFGHFINFIKI